jgi:hypothetical protein
LDWKKGKSVVTLGLGDLHSIESWNRGMKVPQSRNAQRARKQKKSGREDFVQTGSSDPQKRDESAVEISSASGTKWQRRS